jgi:hypothetical protein
VLVAAGVDARHGDENGLARPRQRAEPHSQVDRDITVLRYRDAADVHDPPQTTHALRAEITLGPDLSSVRIFRPEEMVVIVEWFEEA